MHNREERNTTVNAVIRLAQQLLLLCKKSEKMASTEKKNDDIHNANYHCF